MANLTIGSKLNAVFGPIEVHLSLLINRFDEILGVANKASRSITLADQAEINRHLERIDPESKEIREGINGLKPDVGLFADELEKILDTLVVLKNRFVEAKKKAANKNSGLIDDRDDLIMLREGCWLALKGIRLLVTPFEFNEERLTQLRVGLSVDFNKEYEQELKTEIGEDLRPYVLQKLHENKDVYGLVDREYGIVYKISDTWGQYWARVAFVIALPILGFIGVLAYCWLNLANINITAAGTPTPVTTPATASATPTPVTTTATASATSTSPPGKGKGNKKSNFWPLAWYAICFGGYIAHVVKKLLNAAGKDPLVSDVVHWLEIKAFPLASLGVSLWVVFGALLWRNVAGIRTGEGVGLQTVMIAFTAGYFVDSFAEPLLKQFDRRISESKSSLNDLLKAFKPTP